MSARDAVGSAVEAFSAQSGGTSREDSGSDKGYLDRAIKYYGLTLARENLREALGRGRGNRFPMKPEISRAF